MRKFKIADRWMWVDEDGCLCFSWVWNKEENDDSTIVRTTKSDGIRLMATVGRFLDYEISSHYKNLSELVDSYNWPHNYRIATGKKFRVGCNSFTKKKLEPAFLYLIKAYGWEIT